MKLSNPLKLIISIIVCELAGILGSVFTRPSIAGWYAGLVKSPLNPPAWIFAPVWTTLFALMGIAVFLVWKKGTARQEVKIALGLFASQLVLNMLWSIIFFGLHRPGLAFAEIIFLWIAILVTMIAFQKISQPAAWLLVPYILWVGFAGFLNYSVWQLNRAPRAVACTAEAKLCADGSYVGRTGPKCEFAACPNENNNLWKTSTDRSTGLSFQYPETLLTTYLHAVDWPPQLQIIKKPFVCAPGGSEIALNGQTVKRLVDDRVYCVTKASEGAAGSIYTNYTYAFSHDGQTIVLAFTLRAVQCANYDDPQKTACENERASFDLDSVVDRMARSIRF